MKFSLHAIGYVHNAVTAKKDTGWGSDCSTIQLEPAFAGGLTGLETFSHAFLLCYLDQASFDPAVHLQRRPQNRPDMPQVGIFSQRAKDRPNPIGLTAVEILHVTETTLTVKGLDAVDGTPVLDIKPYYPVYDCRGNAVVPEWVDRLMVHYF